ncbi:alcohol dehydrogenase NADP+-dependent [Neoconidiobolus thromboides FSU 785]|nr:alcohol dehydrogenase NADP+-dependent [Neoconidiobolus thromboides FSU 785]
MSEISICNKEFQLNSGYKMPAIGLGTETGDFNANVEAIKNAIKLGYKAIDTAAMYKTEEHIGEAIKQSGVKREELFITSKLWSTDLIPERVVPALQKTLKNLGTDYLDLYLIHFPYAFKHPQSTPPEVIKDFDIMSTWHELEKLVKSGKVRSIGVSNFSIKKLDYLLSHCTIKPAVNQVELHPYLSQEGLVEYCKKNEILITGYSPLGRTIEPAPLYDPIILDISKKYHITPSQVILSWAIQRGTSVVPRSNNPKRQLLNLQIVELDSMSLRRINGVNRGMRLFTFDDMWGVEDAFDEKL